MNANPYVLITGGAGFLGTNLARRLAEEGRSVLLYDDLSRPGVEENVRWLFQHYSPFVTFLKEDIRNEDCVKEAVSGADAVFHLAGQVAVTSSLSDPVHDFEVNSRGTLNVLEAIREMRDRPFLLFPSTRKVVAGWDTIALRETPERYVPEDELIGTWGLDEGRGIQCFSPYGCSKGAAEHYVLDYARSFRIPATVLRLSSIYGPHQCGSGDKGFVTHFLKQALAGRAVTFHGNGKQVRDPLYVSDLVEGFLAAWKMKEAIAGKVFNIGGGPAQTTSLIEFVELVGRICGRTLEVKCEAWRPFDSRYSVSDNRKFSDATGWQPKVSFEDGVREVYQWLDR